MNRHVVPPSSFEAAAPTEETAPPLSDVELNRTFRGFPRRDNRGVGTRNYVVVIGTSSLTAGCVLISLCVHACVCMCMCVHVCV